MSVPEKDWLNTVRVHFELLQQHDAEFKQALISFRSLLNGLRMGLHETANNPEPSPLYHKRLQLLVPIYRAMNCVYQQLNSDCRAGKRQYLKAFAKLQVELDKAAYYPGGVEYPVLFASLPPEYAGDVASQVVLVPGKNENDSGWRLATVGQLLVESKDRVSAKVAKDLRIQREYAQLKREICKSLSNEQRQQLNALLGLARTLGWASVALSPMDING